MSKNKKIKFAKWHEENIKPEYKDEYYNYFLDDEWFESLPKDLKDIIIEIDGTSRETLNYDYLLEKLESEIKDYIFKYKEKNYSADDVQYLFDFMDYSEYDARDNN